jgi:hypothetical protein
MAESLNSANSANSSTSFIAADNNLILAADHNDRNGNIAPELVIQIIVDPHLAHLVHPDLHLQHPGLLLQHPDLHLQHPGLLIQPPNIVLDAVIDNEKGIAYEDSVSDSITTDEHDKFPIQPPILEVVRRSRRLERH